MNRLIVALAWLCLTATMFPAAASAVFPGKSWTVAASPEERGFSPAKLAEARAYSATIATAAVMVVHDGVVVSQWGDVARKFNTHSIRKSFLSVLYGAPVRNGVIRLDVTMAELGIDDVAGLSDEEKRPPCATA